MVEKVEKKVGKTAFQNIKDLTNHNSNITKFGRGHYEDSVKGMFLKTRKILTKTCKGIQYLVKLYTAITKPLQLKLIPLQVPRSSCKNF